jgi:antagonist of KipI
MSIVVVKPGMLTTLQDRGRRGCAALGVGVAGPMDDVALRLANALVGNADAAALEISMLGPRLRFDRDAIVALTGADFDVRINARAAGMWRPLQVGAGAVLECGVARRGARAYLAVAGGFAVAPVLGSAASDVNARLGPFGGRALAAGDTLAIVAGTVVDSASAAANRRSRMAAWSLDPRPWFDIDPARPLRLMRGAHFDALDAASRKALFAQEFRIGADSNRAGFRLDGPRLALAAPLELASEPVAFGTLQLPPGGQPIALMAEHPTTGGYPRIGQIAAIDLPRLAQRRPGDRVHFLEIGIDEAQTRYLARERELARLLETIAARLAE